MTLMRYDVQRIADSQTAALVQRTPEGWITLGHYHQSVAVRKANRANERLQALYRENGHHVTIPRCV